MTRARILVVEDDASLNEIVETFLAKEGYDVDSAFSGSEARMLIERYERDGASAPDLIICDLMLPGLPGEQLVDLIRTRLGAVPVIITSARSAVSDRVGLLRCGADDYLVKPFDLEELAARIEVQLRRHPKGTEARCDAAGGRRADGPGDGPHREKPLVHGVWKLDPARRKFTAGDQEIRLTRTEFDILAALMSEPERVFSKRSLYLASCRDDLDLADAAAGTAAVTRADERTVATHVSNLRAKLRDADAPDLIETVWGIGFKLSDV